MRNCIECILVVAVLACMATVQGYAEEAKPKPGDAKVLVGNWTLNKESGQTFLHALFKFGVEGGDSRGDWSIKFTETEAELTLAFPNGNTGLQQVASLGHGWLKPVSDGKGTKVVWSYKYTLDTTASPYTIDLTPQNMGEVISPPLQGKPLKGIWKIESGSLHLCYADAGQDRPGKFLGWDHPPLSIAYLIFDKQKHGK